MKKFHQKQVNRPVAAAEDAYRSDRWWRCLYPPLHYPTQLAQCRL